ncbi:MAG: hypothetical protein ACD_78C00211G0001, partial [uncultured bacterium (gcode 4)]
MLFTTFSVIFFAGIFFHLIPSSLFLKYEGESRSEVEK